jgi:excisionase family DNA binding protein
VNPQAKLIGIVDVAQLIGVSADSVRRLIKRGQIRSVRVLGRVMVPRAEVDRLCAGQVEATTSQTPRQ